MAESKQGIGLLGWTGRLLLAAVLVFATYNPSGHSYWHWLRQSLPGGVDALVVFTGVVLAIGWTIYLRATLRSLGGLGLVLTTAFFTALLWLLADWGVLPIDDRRTVIWLGELVLTAVLAVGLGWSLVQRRLTGQVDVDDVEED